MVLGYFLLKQNKSNQTNLKLSFLSFFKSQPLFLSFSIFSNFPHSPLTSWFLFVCLFCPVSKSKEEKPRNLLMEGWGLWTEGEDSGLPLGLGQRQDDHKQMSDAVPSSLHKGFEILFYAMHMLGPVWKQRWPRAFFLPSRNWTIWWSM